MLCSTVNSTHNTRPLLPKNSGNRQGRSILTGVECRRATDGLLLLGNCDRSVPRSCCWETRQSTGCPSPSYPRPHRKIRRFGDGWFGRIRWIFPNRGRQDCLQKQECRTHLTCCVDSTRKSGRLPQEPHPPRRAHDTLQPQDESIIVGYYTSAEVLPRKLPRPAQSEIRR